MLRETRQQATTNDQPSRRRFGIFQYGCSTDIHSHLCAWGHFGCVDTFKTTETQLFSACSMLVEQLARSARGGTLRSSQQMLRRLHLVLSGYVVHDYTMYLHSRAKRHSLFTSLHRCTFGTEHAEHQEVAQPWYRTVVCYTSVQG